jgi:hypothetical protein
VHLLRRSDFRQAARSRHPLLEDIHDLLAAVLVIPFAWAIPVTLLALASSVRVLRDARGSYGVEFRVTWITGLLFALVWLPALLRVISLVGGGLKTSAVEATTGGLLGLLGSLNPDAKRDVYPTVIAALDKTGVTGEPQVRRLRTVLQEELPRPHGDVHQLLDELAERYERLRSSLPPGDERTFFMTRIVVEARAAAGELHLPEDDARRYFEAGTEGKRIIALAIAQADPSAVLFDIVSEAIANSRSAFEQFHALRALDEMLYTLSPMQRRQARALLEQQRAPDGWITPEDPSRWEYSAHLLEQLRNT